MLLLTAQATNIEYCPTTFVQSLEKEGGATKGLELKGLEPTFILYRMDLWPEESLTFGLICPLGMLPLHSQVLTSTHICPPGMPSVLIACPEAAPSFPFRPHQPKFPPGSNLVTLTKDRSP